MACLSNVQLWGGLTFNPLSERVHKYEMRLGKSVQWFNDGCLRQKEATVDDDKGLLGLRQESLPWIRKELPCF